MLLLVEEGIIRGISHVVHKHTITKNKYMKDYEPSTSCNGMSQIYMDGPCHKSWIKNESRSLRNHTKLWWWPWQRIHSWSWCWLSQMSARRYTVISSSCLNEWRLKQIQKLVRSMHENDNYVALIREKVYWIVKFNQEAWLWPYIDKNVESIKTQKINLN